MGMAGVKYIKGVHPPLCLLFIHPRAPRLRANAMASRTIDWIFGASAIKCW